MVTEKSEIADLWDETPSGLEWRRQLPLSSRHSARAVTWSVPATGPRNPCRLSPMIFGCFLSPSKTAAEAQHDKDPVTRPAPSPTADMFSPPPRPDGRVRSARHRPPAAPDAATPGPPPPR
ncbi:hypothetical protein SHO565_58280 [Streptomyces sp. HO565]